MKVRFLLPIFTLITAYIFNIQLVKATHVSGADITYKCLGGNKYEFTAAVYRDCASSVSISNVELDFSSTSCGESFSLTLQEQSIEDISQICATSESTCDDPFASVPGREKVTFVDTLTLPANCSDWVVSYSNCCRNDAINNLQVDGGTTELYLEITLDNSNGLCNNSPQYASLPSPYICTNQLFSYDHGAYDIDGDSLAFEMVTPLEGTTSGVPIPFETGYSLNQPVLTTNSFDFDSTSGRMCFTPNSAQIAVIAVKISEYRNGVVIATHIREMQLIISNTCNNTPPVVGGNNATCDELGTISDFFVDGNGVQINNNTISICLEDSVSFRFFATDPDGGKVTVINNLADAIPTAKLDTQVVTQDSVVGTFGWRPTGSEVGSYTFTVTLEDDACPIKGVQNFTFLIHVTEATDAGENQVICGPNTQFPGQAHLQAVGGSQFTWTTVSGDPIVVGTNFSCNPCSNPIATPTVTTVYAVQSNLATGCNPNDTVTVFVVPDYDYTFIPSDTAICLNHDVQVTVTPTVVDNYTYSWFINGVAVAADSANPIFNFSEPGIQKIHFDITSSAGCLKSDTITVNVSVGQTPDITVVGDTTVCETSSSLLFAQNNVIQTCEYTLRLIDTSSFGTEWGFSDSVWFFVADTLVDTYTKTNSSNDSIQDYKIAVTDGDSLSITADFGFSSNIGYQLFDAQGNLLFVDGTATNILSWQGIANCGSNNSTYKYIWSPTGTLSSSDIVNPLASPVDDTTTYTVIVTDSIGGCADTADITLYIVPNFTLSVTQTKNTICLLGESDFTALPVGSDTTYFYEWSPAGYVNNDTLQTITATFPKSGTDWVYVTVTSDSGCTRLDSANISVTNNVQPNILVTGDTTVCEGDSTQLMVVNLNESQPITELFDDTIINPLINSSGGSVTDVCGAATSDSAFHFNSAIGVERFVATENINMISCDSVSFCLFIGNDVSGGFLGGSQCENVDVNEEITFEYSIDDGNNWIEIELYDQADWDMSGQYSDAWQCFNLELPILARTNNTILRWRQLNHSGLGSDNWAIDDISTSCGKFTLIHAWSPNIWIDDTTSFSPWINALRDTTYSFVLADTAGGCFDTATVNIDIVPTFGVTSTQSKVAACRLEEVQLEANPDSNFIFTYQWFPEETVDFDTSKTPIAQFTDPGSNTVVVEVTSAAGCSILDTVTVTVSEGVQPNISVLGDTMVCLGDSTQLFIQNESIINLLTNGFDPNYDTLWSSNTGTLDSNDCTGSVSGNALSFNSGGTRELATQNLNVSTGGTVSFWLRMPQNGGTGCDAAELIDSVIVEYSIDSGATWIVIDGYIPANYDNWTQIILSIPQGAQSTATQFRWSQPNHAGTDFDTWALDKISIFELGTNYTYRWTPNIAINNDSIANPWVISTTDITYEVIVTDTVGGCADTTNVFVNIVPTFTLTTLRSDTAICLGESAEFIVQSNTPTSDSLFSWTPGGSTNDTALIAFHTPGINTIYNTVTSDSGCTKMDSTTILVSNNFPPMALVTGDTTVCEGSSTQLFAIDENCAYTFVLIGSDIFNDGWDGNTLDLFIQDTLYRTLTLADTLGIDSIVVAFNRGDSLSVQYTANSFLAFEQSYAILDNSGQEIFSDGPDPATTLNSIGVIDCNTLFDESVYSFEWSPTVWLDDASISNPNVTPVSDTTYSVKVIDKVGGCFDSVSVFVDVVPNFSYDTTQTAPAICLEEQVQFTVTPNPAGTYSYDWTPGSPLDDSTGNVPTATLITSGTNTFKYDVTSAAGCTKTDSFLVEVSPALTPNITITGQTPICEGDSTRLFVQNNSIPSQPCDYTFALHNNGFFSPGWSGAEIQVFINNNFAVSFDLIGAPDAIETLSVTQGDSIRITYTGTNDFSSYENAFEVINGNGDTILSKPFESFFTPNYDTSFVGKVFCQEVVTSTYQYNWTPSNQVDDPNSSSPMTVALSTPTTYQVIVQDAIGNCSDTATFTVDVAPNFTYTLTPADTTICLNESIQFQIVPSFGGSFNYDWKPNNLFNNSNIENPIATFIAPGVHEDTFTVASAAGCVKTGTYKVTVTPNATPNILVIGDNSICEGETTQLQVANQAAQGGTLVYEWIPGTGLSDSTINNPMASPTTTTSYQVIATDTSGGCTDTTDANFVLTVNDNPEVNLTIPQSIFCQDDASVTFTGTPTGGTWSGTSGGINAISGEFNPSQVTAFGNDTITYSVTVNNCIGSADTVVTVFANPNAPTVTGDTVYCNGSTLNLTSLGSTTWYSDAALTNEISDINTVLASNTTIYAVDSSTEGCVSSTTAIEIISLANPVVSFTHDYDDTPAPVVVNFNNITSPAAETYEWDYGTRNISNTINGSNLYDVPGTYNVSLTGTVDSLGVTCSDSEVLPITILDFKLKIPNVFTPNDDGENDVFKVEAAGVEDFEIVIFNRWGKKIWECGPTNDPSQECTWDGGNKVEGTYYYVITTNKGGGIEVTDEDVDKGSRELKGSFTLLID